MSTFPEQHHILGARVGTVSRAADPLVHPNQKKRVLVVAHRYHRRITLTNSTVLVALSALRLSFGARQLRGLRTPLIKESRIVKLIAASVPRERSSPASAAKRTCIVLFSMVLSAVSCLARAEADYPGGDQPRPWSIEQWYVFTSLYTHHFDPDPDHVNNQKMLGLEAGMQNRWVFGLALFDNSFGQNTQYLYAGYKWGLFGSELWHFKLTGGLLHGYKEPYESKIPLNDLGVAPAILPTLGFQYRFFAAEFNLAGTAAFTITAGIVL